MDKIALIPMFLAFGLLLYKEPRDLFIYYFIPILTVFPIYYQTDLAPGLPEFSFWSSALLPILIVWVINKRMKGYQVSWLDLIIVVHLLIIFYGQWMNSNYKEAQKILFNDVMARLVPYILVKSYFTEGASRIQMLKVIVIMGAIVGFFNLYEMRMWTNVFDSYIRDLWPDHVPWDLPMKRGGFKRASGSFGHPICAGYFFAIVVPIALWIWREKLFDKKFVGVSIMLLCIAGALASISRAPIIGMFASFVIIWFGWSQRKIVVLGIVSVALLISLIFMLPKFISYVSVDRSSARTEEQENAAYRKELLDNYMEVLAEKPFFGWGRFTVPVVKGQKSIDNEYLFLALVSGKVSLYLYILTIVWVLARLLRFSIKSETSDPQTRLAWCLIAALTASIFTQTTVYAGTQTVQFFYMLIGMCEALIISPRKINESITETLDILSSIKNRYGFTRTLPEMVQEIKVKEKIEKLDLTNEYNFSRTL